MSRLFTKNLSNYMSLGISGLGPSLSARSAFSIHAKVKPTALGISDGGSVLSILDNATTVGVSLGVTPITGTVKLSARSVSTDAKQTQTGTTSLTAGVPAYIGGVVNVSSATIAVFVNGVSEGSVGVVFANGGWTFGTPTDADTVGGFRAPPVATTDQFDGEISEIALWATVLSGTDFATLATGASADTVQAGSILYYLKITGTASPELPTLGSAQGTITGSLPPSSAIQLRPNADVSTGSWTPTGSATLFGAIDEDPTDDADVITSAASPVNDVCEVALTDPATTAAGTTTIVVRVKHL